MGVPVLINYLFKHPAKNECFAAEWTAGDALSYYGDILTFLSTTFLSILALWQNHVIREKNDKHTEILERMEREKNAPYLVIDNITSYKNAGDITLSVRNVSENIAQKITVSEVHILDKENNIIWNKLDMDSVEYLCKDMSLIINLTNPEISDIMCRIEFAIKYYDKFNKIHICKAIGHFVERISNLHFDIIEE